MTLEPTDQVDPDKRIALRNRYLEQASLFELEADRHRHLAATAEDPIRRREHEQAVIGYDAQVVEMQQRAREQLAMLEEGRREAIEARQAETLRETQDRERADAERVAAEERARIEAEAEKKRLADEVERQLKEARDRIARNRRREPTPFD